MKLFFHDAAAEAKVGEFEVLVDTPEGRKSLGVFNGSVGSDGSVATTIDFKFNILNPGPIKLYIRCITKGFVFNGFEVTKFFAGPSKDDTTLILECGPSEKATENVFMNPTLWTERFSRDYDIRPFSAPDYNPPSSIGRRGWRR